MSDKRKDSANSNILAEERDLKFKLWLQNKALKEKAFEVYFKLLYNKYIYIQYVDNLDASRGESKESVINLAVSLLAIERLIPSPPPVKEEDDDKNKDKKIQPRTLKSAWVKFVTEHHTFDNVVLSDEDLNELSGGTKENLKSQAELTAYDLPSNDNSESKREPPSKVQNIILSLIY